SCVQEPLGSAPQASCLLAISVHSRFRQRLAIEARETRFFIHARKFTDNPGQMDLPSHWIENSNDNMKAVGVSLSRFVKEISARPHRWKPRAALPASFIACRNSRYPLGDLRRIGVAEVLHS